MLEWEKQLRIVFSNLHQNKFWIRLNLKSQGMIRICFLGPLQTEWRIVRERVQSLWAKPKGWNRKVKVLDLQITMLVSPMRLKWEDLVHLEAQLRERFLLGEFLTAHSSTVQTVKLHQSDTILTQTWNTLGKGWISLLQWRKPSMVQPKSRNQLGRQWKDLALEPMIWTLEMNWRYSTINSRGDIKFHLSGPALLVLKGERSKEKNLLL